MKYKLVTGLLSLTLALSGASATAFAASGNSPLQSTADIRQAAAEIAAYDAKEVDLDQKDGKLTITEPGSYVLTGKLTGCVYVDPGEGEVELILDGVDIDGGNGAGIAVVSGDSLKVTLPEGSVSRVTDGNEELADNDHHFALLADAPHSSLSFFPFAAPAIIRFILSTFLLVEI